MTDINDYLNGVELRERESTGFDSDVLGKYHEFVKQKYQTEKPLLKDWSEERGKTILKSLKHQMKTNGVTMSDGQREWCAHFLIGGNWESFEKRMAKYANYNDFCLSLFSGVASGRDVSEFTDKQKLTIHRNYFGGYHQFIDDIDFWKEVKL